MSDSLCAGVDLVILITLYLILTRNGLKKPFLRLGLVALSISRLRYGLGDLAAFSMLALGASLWLNRGWIGEMQL